MEFFASAISGTEALLRDELNELGLSGVRIGHSGVRFEGTLRDGALACLHSRLAQRIMLELGHFEARDQEGLYRGAAGIGWSDYVTPTQTLAVAAHVRSSHTTHSGYAALCIKDAIVDVARAEFDDRPNIDKTDPDVRVFMHLFQDVATVYLDMSATALFMRGYRTDAGEAPLKETLAAALLRFSGWDREMPLLDPFCGSGTIPIEAALWAGNVAPAISRKTFGFERWANFGPDEADMMRDLRGQARAEAGGRLPRVAGSDFDADVVDIARKNARRAGVRISLKQQAMQDLGPDGPPRMIVTNPPYDVRLGAGNSFFQEITAAFRRLHGWRVCILAGTPLIPNNMVIEPIAELPVSNGPIPCKMLLYEIP